MPSVQGFLPSQRGLHFVNSFANVPLKTIDIAGVQVPIGNAANGLCGGMVFAACDYFAAGVLPPADVESPSSGPLFDYLVNRLVDSFNLFGLPPGPMRYLQLMNPALPDGETWLSRVGLAPHGRAWVMIKQEWPKIRAEIEAERLCPIGLVKIKSADPFALGLNHQVLVYGYDLQGDELTLRLYDPNEPDDDNVTLLLNMADPRHATPVHYSHPLPGYPDVYAFFRVTYMPAPPP
jgi:hypothetical protein